MLLTSRKLAYVSSFRDWPTLSCLCIIFFKASGTSQEGSLVETAVTTIVVVSAELPKVMFPTQSMIRFISCELSR
jgi:hypothetical protein